MAFDIAGLLPGGQAFTQILGDVKDIANVLGGLGGGQPAQQAQAPARPADAFQAAPAPQQQAAAGGPAQFGDAINQIMQALTAITQMLGKLTGQGGAQQAQAPAVGVGQGGGAPAQVGGAAPQAGAAAPQAGAPQVQGGQGTIVPQPAPAPQGGINQNLALHGTGLILEGMGELLQALAGGKGAGQPGTPNPTDSGGLSATAGASAVTTSGGYKIESDGQYQWKVTGPDGKPFSVDGDPHVHMGDGTNFDFKKDASFVLPDGTRINCKTKDLGNGTSVSSALEIENNGQRAVLGGLDAGKGKVETVDKGPEQFHTDQTFTIGTDGSAGINGKKITGNDGGADKYKLGGDQQLTQQATAAAGAAAGAGGAGQAGGLGGLLAQIQQIMAGLTGQQQPAQGTAAAPGNQPAAQQPPVQNQPAAQPPAQQAKPQDTLSQLLGAIVGMLQALLPLLGGLKGGGVQA